jgi:putative endonuclease
VFVYVLWSEKLQKRYIGSCEDVPRRLDEHNRGKERFTKGGIPWIVVYQEQCVNRSEARKRELYLKSGIGRQWLDGHLAAISKF